MLISFYYENSREYIWKNMKFNSDKILHVFSVKEAVCYDWSLSIATRSVPN